MLSRGVKLLKQKRSQTPSLLIVSWQQIMRSWGSFIQKPTNFMHMISFKKTTLIMPAYLRYIEFTKNIYSKKSFDAGFLNIRNIVWPAACRVQTWKLLWTFINYSYLIFFFRNDANSILYSLLPTKNDGAQNGNLEVLRFSNICCDWAQCHYHGNGILHDASCK